MDGSGEEMRNRIKSRKGWSEKEREVEKKRKKQKKEVGREE